MQGAIIDPSEKYRYLLWRKWDISLPMLTFIMLNPSTADANEDDATIRRCIGFAKRWGFGGIEVVNLFAYRATDPMELTKALDPVGKDNDYNIIKSINRATSIVAAWGTKGNYKDRDKQVMKLLNGRYVTCLEVTKMLMPKHPLYVKGDIERVSYVGR